MTIITVDDLHTVPDPERHLAIKAASARAQAGTTATRLIVRVPDRATDGVRAYRPEDIATMLQRHARIRELAVTDNGTIVAAGDVIDRRGNVAIWTGQAIGSWHPSDITTVGLGGSETAAVRLAEQLAEMRYVVTLYGDFEQTGMCGDVLLKRFTQFDPSEPLDALVLFRNARPLDEWGHVNAGWVGLWLEDLADPVIAEGLNPDRAGKIDKVIAVSHWHRNQVLEVHPWLEPEKVSAGRNGVHLEWFGEQPAPEREQRVVYSSSPDRGGDIVLEVWPKIREQVPDAELILTYPRWFELCADALSGASAHRERLRELLKQPGVNRLDEGMGQKALANLMRSSLVWVNPGYHTPASHKFCETSCISCMEAQAAGCVVVASNWGALTENVGPHGTLLDGDPGEQDGEWRHAFIDAIVRGLTDETVQATAQTLGPEFMKHMDWRGAAEQLEAMFPRVRKTNL